MSKKIGIYPGTFDPLHIGHLAFAEDTLSACGLDKVIFLPEARPRHKPHVSELIMRTQHIKHAIADNPFLGVFHPTTDRFTIKETLPEIQHALQQDGVTFLVGSDVIKTIHSWPDVEILLNYAHIAVGMRYSESKEEVETIIENLQNLYSVRFSHTIIYTHHTDISSTSIRNSRTKGLLLPEKYDNLQ